MLNGLGPRLRRERAGAVAVPLAVWAALCALGAALLARRQVALLLDWAGRARQFGSDGDGFTEQLLLVLPRLHQVLTATAALAAAATLAAAYLERRVLAAGRADEAAAMALLGADPVLARLRAAAQGATVGMTASVLALVSLVGTLAALRAVFAGWSLRQASAAGGLRLLAPADVWSVCPALLLTGVAGVAAAAVLAVRGGRR